MEQISYLQENLHDKLIAQLVNYSQFPFLQNRDRINKQSKQKINEPLVWTPRLQLLDKSSPWSLRDMIAAC